LHKAIQAGLVQSCHDVSEGGIAVALAEMCIAGGFGFAGDFTSKEWNGEVWTEETLRAFLFSETSSRFIVEVSEADDAAFTALFEDYPHIYREFIGRVVDDNHDWKSYWTEYGDKDFQNAFFGITLQIAYSGVFEYLTTPAELERAYRGEEAVTPSPSPSAEREQYVQKVDHPARRVLSRQSAARVLILHANGSNRDHDAALACELAGGAPEIVHINQLLAGERDLLDYHMLVVPGGFSYGDDLGAGQLWAQDLRYKLRDSLGKFAKDGRPVLGICNGFQVLLKSGLLPDTNFTAADARDVTLTYNERSQFECRWVYLKPNANSTSLFTEGLSELIYCPVAHGEGRVMVRDENALNRLWSNGQVALSYVDANGEPVGYPGNPNGSVAGIAALCNREGNVMGLMPHPEDHIFAWQHPRYHRGERGSIGLVLFQNGIRYA
jgi:phosphoribosylformylglycinamidine synthase I